MSEGPTTLARMFDSSLPDPEGLRRSDDAAVVAAIEGWARVEAAAAARRLDAIAELLRRQSGHDDERAHWSCDYWDAAAAEVAAAQGISQGRASGQLQLAVTLRDRLPQVAALFMAGGLSAYLVSVVAWRTYLVQDEQALNLLDTAIAQRAAGWGTLSAYKLEQAIDAWVDRYDQGALRHTRAAARSRNVSVGAADDQGATAALWGRLYATDAALLDRRLTQMAHGVCHDDPRTIAQRRADALGALAAGADRLTCACDHPHCPAAGRTDERAAAVVVHVLAEQSALSAPPDLHMSGTGGPSRPITADMTLAEALAPDPEPDAPKVHEPPAVIVGGGIIPAPLLAELITRGATARPLRPAGHPVPEPHYRPSRTLQEFIRARDLTCRFPGCDRPTQFCDIDHTRPWPLGPTHAANLKCLCRRHHLLKTFWTGIGGWTDRQLADGTVIWTAPSGRTYRTQPGCRLYFPDWDPTTRALPTTRPATPPAPGRSLMMPTRRRTRAADRALAINAERALNDAYVAERNTPPPF